MFVFLSGRAITDGRLVPYVRQMPDHVMIHAVPRACGNETTLNVATAQRKVAHTVE